VPLLCRVFCRCRRLRRLDRAFVILTLAAVAVVAAGLFTNSYIPVIDRSAGFLVTYAGANLYVAWLILLYWPPRPDLTNSADTEDREAARKRKLQQQQQQQRSMGGVIGEGIDTTAIDAPSPFVPPRAGIDGAKAAGAALAEAELAALSTSGFDLSDSDEEEGGAGQGP
jgi:hypothetical protein